MGCVQNWPLGGESVVKCSFFEPSKVRLLKGCSRTSPLGPSLSLGAKKGVEQGIALHAILDPIQILYKIFAPA